MKKKLQVLVFTLVLYSLFLPKSYAQDKLNQAEILSVSPSILNIELSPGKTYNYTIKVKNLTDTTLPLLVSFENFDSAGEDGGYVFNNSASSFNSITPWLSADKRELLLDPKQETAINLAVAIPDRVPLGGYYGIMFLESAAENTQSNTQVATKVGVLLLGNIGLVSPNQESAAIVDFSYDNLFNEKTSVPLSFRIKNQTLNHFSAKPNLVVKDLFGKEKKIDFKEQFVFPGKIRRWTEAVNLDKPLTGIYFTTLNVSIGNGVFFSKSKILLAFPFAKTLTVILIILLVIIIYSKRRRLKKAFYILLFNK